MIRIKRINRIAIAVKDLDAAVENWKKLFDVKPTIRGAEPGDRLEWVALNIGEGEATIELYSPLNDPNGEMPVGKFIKEHGEGVYMMTLETVGSSSEVVEEFSKTGIKPAWGGLLKRWSGKFFEKAWGAKSWTEHYLHPRDANGVLLALASVEYADPEFVVGAPPAETIHPK